MTSEMEGKTEMKFDLTHAKHDTMHCLAPGLFQSLRRGERKKMKLDVTYDYGKNESARFVGFEPLGADDMRLLQGIIAMSGPDGLLLNDRPPTKLGRHLRALMATKGEAKNKNALAVNINIVQLLSEIGLTDGGENIKAVYASLLRMSNVTILIKRGSQQATFHLLSYALDENSGKLFVALNPRLAEAILGDRPYTRIDMNEIRALNSDPARLIHQRLCGWLGKEPAKVSMETLINYVWPKVTDNPNTLKTRKAAVRKAIAELVALGWSFCKQKGGVYEVSKPHHRSNSTLSP